MCEQTDSRRGDADSGDRPSLDGLMDALADDRRRLTLSVVDEVRTPVRVSSLARAVTEREADARVRDLSESAVNRTHTSLYHLHLPKLAEVGAVEYDPDRGVVEGPAPEAMALL